MIIGNFCITVQAGLLSSLGPWTKRPNWKNVLMTCPEYNEADGKCGVDGFKFYTGMQKPCDTPGITKEKCPRFAMK